MAWQFRATFADGIGAREYLSPDVRFNDPGWGSEVFRHPIEKLEFYLPTGHKIVMAGMESYNFFIEASRSFSGGSRIEGIWLLGKPYQSEVVEMWRVADGKVIRQRGQYGKEWGGGPTQGWKAGLPSSSPVATLLQQ